MGLLLIVLGILIWLLVSPLIGIILVILGAFVFFGGLASGRRYY